MKATARKPTAERREEIACAVLQIVGERGLTSLTTSTLAAEVGLTTGALYRHFASLDEILIETVRFGVAQIDATFPDPALPPMERLLALARNRARLLGDNAGIVWLLRSQQAYLSLPSDAVTMLHDVVARSRRFVLAALRDGVRSGEVRDDIAADLLLVPVLGTIHAVIGSRDAPDRVLGALAQLLARLPKQGD